MTIHSRKPLLAVAALVAALSAPLAFAQTASPEPAQDAAAAQAEPAAPAAAATAAPQKKSWADVDTNKDGALSKTEAATVPALGQVFDKADSNADGALTTDEYKAYVAKVQSTPGKSGSGGGTPAQLPPPAGAASAALVLHANRKGSRHPGERRDPGPERS